MIFCLPSAVLFDWDNTLVDSWYAIKLGMDGALAHFGMDLWSLDDVRTRCKLAAKDYFPAIFGDRWREAADQYYVHFHKARQLTPTSARPGAENLLIWLNEKQIPLFVVSNKEGGSLRREADALNWTRYFVKIVGANDAEDAKPSRAPVDFALLPMDLKADQSMWFVGDTDVDMQCARNAGCTPIFVGSSEEAQELGVSTAFDDCQAFLDWMRRFA
jgi:phosphoglycolate phosphatase